MWKEVSFARKHGSFAHLWNGFCHPRPSPGLQARPLAGFRLTVIGSPLHPCERTSATAPHRSPHSSFTAFGCGSAMSAVCANACHRPSIHHLRSSDHASVVRSPKQSAKRSSDRTRSVGQRSLPKQAFVFSSCAAFGRGG